MSDQVPHMNAPPPIGLGLRYLGYHVLTSHRGRPEAIELRFGDEGPDRTMVVHQRVIISADCDGYLEEAVYLRFTAVPPKEVH